MAGNSRVHGRVINMAGSSRVINMASISRVHGRVINRVPVRV